MDDDDDLEAGGGDNKAEEHRWLNHAEF